MVVTEAQTSTQLVVLPMPLARVLLEHPWLSDRRKRYSNLLMLAKPSNACPSTVQIFAPKSDHQDVECNATSEDTMKPTLDLVQAVIRTGEVSAIVNNYAETFSLLDRGEVKKIAMFELDRRNKTEMETTVLRLFMDLPNHAIGSPTFPLVCLFVEILLDIYLNSHRLPISQTLFDQIAKVVKMTDLEYFAFRSVLPIILQSNAGLYSTFILSTLRTASDHMKITFLRAFCSMETPWPTESFPIMRFLFEQIHPTCLPDTDLNNWTEDVVAAFARQLCLKDELYKCAPFANLLLVFIRNHFVHIHRATWNSLTEIAERQNNFLRNPLLQLVSHRASCGDNGSYSSAP